MVSRKVASNRMGSHSKSKRTAFVRVNSKVRLSRGNRFRSMSYDTIKAASSKGLDQTTPLLVT